MTTLKYPYNKLNPVFTCSYVAVYRDICTGKIESATRYMDIRAFDRAEAKRICKLLSGAPIKSISIESKGGYDYTAVNDNPELRARMNRG